MNTHMLHVGGGRLTNTKVSTGADDGDYLKDFETAWEMITKNLTPKHRQLFREEIYFRLCWFSVKWSAGTLR